MGSTLQHTKTYEYEEDSVVELFTHRPISDLLAFVLHLALLYTWYLWFVSYWPVPLSVCRPL